MYKKLIFLGMVSIVGIHSTSIYACSVARCLGKICINQTEITPASLTKKYGPGYTRYAKDDQGILVQCYYDEQQKYWVEFEFSPKNHGGKERVLTGIFLTRVQMCPITAKPFKSLPVMASEFGVSVGMSEKQLLEKMGRPSRRDDVVEIENKSKYLAEDERYSSKYGAYRYVYDNNQTELLFNFYGIVNGVVQSIWLAERE